MPSPSSSVMGWLQPQPFRTPRTTTPSTAGSKAPMAIWTVMSTANRISVSLWAPAGAGKRDKDTMPDRHQLRGLRMARPPSDDSHATRDKSADDPVLGPSLEAGTRTQEGIYRRRPPLRHRPFAVP